MKKVILATIALASLISSHSYAASSNVRSDRNSECYIWLCLPAGFANPACSTAFSGFIGRITDLTPKGGRKYTDLPAFSHCIDDVTSEQRKQIEDIKEQVGFYDFVGQDYNENDYTPDQITYGYHDYKIVIPEHKLCTNWKEKYQSKYDKVEICIADTTVAEKIEFSKKPKIVKYEVSKVGDIKHKDNDLLHDSLLYQRTSVFVKGEQYGEIFEQQITHWI